jgi:hypothetical protein
MLWHPYSDITIPPSESPLTHDRPNNLYELGIDHFLHLKLALFQVSQLVQAIQEAKQEAKYKQYYSQYESPTPTRRR